VLEQELQDEERSLAEAKRAFDEAIASDRTASGDPRGRLRAKPLEDAVSRHARNAEAIRRELANLR
jgi:hypothetical protein